MSTQGTNTIKHDKMGFLIGDRISLSQAEKTLKSIDSNVQSIVDLMNRSALSNSTKSRNVGAVAVQVARPSNNVKKRPEVTVVLRSKVNGVEKTSPKVVKEKATQGKDASVDSKNKPLHKTISSEKPVAVSPRVADGRAANGRFSKKTDLPYGVSGARIMERSGVKLAKIEDANASKRHGRLFNLIKRNHNETTSFDKKQAGWLSKMAGKAGSIIRIGGGAAAGGFFSGGVAGEVADLAGGVGVAARGAKSVGRGFGGAGKLLKRVPVLGAMLAIGGILTAKNTNASDGVNSKNDGGQTIAGAVGDAVGGLGGAMAGASAGALIGSAIPVIGTAIGSVAGGIIGGIGGGKIGEKVGEWLYKKDWKTGWSDVRGGITSTWSGLTENMSLWSSTAWDGMASYWNSTWKTVGELFPTMTSNIEEIFESLASTLSRQWDKAKKLAGDTVEAGTQMLDAASSSYHGEQVAGANADGTTTTAQNIGAAVGGAGGWIKTHNPFSYEGLKLSGDATSGGKTENGVTAMTHAVDGKFGSDVLRHAALNDDYHHSKNIKYHSLHRDGLGFDTTFKSANEMQAQGLRNGKNTAAAQRYTKIKQYAESLGFKVGGKGSDIEMLDEYNNPSKKSTGGHIHFAFRNKAAAKRYEDLVRGDAAGATAESPPTTMERLSRLTGSARDTIRAKFGMNPKHSADKNANVKEQSAKRADAALDFSGGVVNGLSDAQTRALMASKQETEANFNPRTTNRSGYVGLYQFGAAALEDIGVLKKGTSKGGNAAMDDANNWTIGGGKQTFLGSKELQDKAAVKYANILVRRGIGAHALSKSSSAEAKAGYIKAAWLKGNGGANDLVLRGKDSKDGMGTSALKYFNDGVNAVKYDAPIIQSVLSSPIPPAPTEKTASIAVDYRGGGSVNSQQATPQRLDSGGKSKNNSVAIADQAPPATQNLPNDRLAHIASGGMGDNMTA